MEKYIEYFSDVQNVGSSEPVKSPVSVSEDDQQDGNYAYIEEILDMDDRMSEFCILGLRMCEGISKREFKQRFGSDIYEIFGKETALADKIFSCQ